MMKDYNVLVDADKTLLRKAEAVLLLTVILNRGIIMIFDDEKLAQDVPILSAMAAEMANYLDSDILFWPLSGSRMPRLTLGGYLMRQQRLLILKNSLKSKHPVMGDTS